MNAVFKLEFLFARRDLFHEVAGVFLGPYLCDAESTALRNLSFLLKIANVVLAGPDLFRQVALFVFDHGVELAGRHTTSAARGDAGAWCGWSLMAVLAVY